MKRFWLMCFVILFVSAGCSKLGNVSAIEPKLLEPTKTQRIEPIVTSVPTNTPTIEPSPTATTEFYSERQLIKQIMESYGVIDEKLLSDEYWKKIAQEISKYGEAKRILTLEYHGDNYYMYDGAYSMTPEQFEIQMRYLLTNDYHFVTGPELVGFLEGWLNLPTRSVILTTDSGEASYKSFPRIIALFDKLKEEFGVAPHMNSFIWTLGMAETENGRCKKDACWQFFRDALQTGYFSFGTHTESHKDFSKLSDGEIAKDINQSKQEIHDNLGLNVYGLSWPLEECAKNTQLMTSLGMKYGFAGSSRERAKLFTYANDNLALCLPRLFPPNPGGYSGRPNNMKLSEMLDEAMNIDVPLK